MSQEVLDLPRRDEVGVLAELRRHQHRPAVGLHDLHPEVGLLDRLAPADHPVVGHQDGVVLVGQRRDGVGHRLGAGGEVRRDRHHPAHDLHLRDHGVGRRDPGDREAGGVGRVGVDAGPGPGLHLEDGQVHRAARWSAAWPPAFWFPSMSTRQRSSGTMNPLETRVGLQSTRSSATRMEMFPPLPST